MLNVDIGFKNATPVSALAAVSAAAGLAALFLITLGLTLRDLHGIESNDLAVREISLSTRSAAIDSSGPIPDQVKRANVAIAELNLPWPALLRVLEDTANPDVLLLKLAPDPSQRELHIEAVAKNDAAMLEYSRAIQRQPGIAEVRFVKQALSVGDQTGASKFEMNVFWESSL